MPTGAAPKVLKSVVCCMTQSPHHPSNHSRLLHHALVVASILHCGVTASVLLEPAWHPFYTWESLGALYTIISLAIWRTRTEEQRKVMLLLPVTYCVCRWTASWLLGDPMEVYTSTIDMLLYFPVLVGCGAIFGAPRWIGAGLSIFLASIALAGIQRPELSQSVLSEWRISPAMLMAYFLYNTFFITWRRHIQDLQDLQAKEHELNLALQKATAHQMATRMSAVSKFSGEFAHEFNNLLAIVSPLSSLLVEELQETRHAEDLRDIQTATERMRLLSQQLLSLTQTSRILEEVTDLTQVFDDMAAEIEQATQHELASLKLHVQSGQTFVPVSSSQTDLKSLIALLSQHINALSSPNTEIVANLKVIDSAEMTHALDETWHDKIAFISIGHRMEALDNTTSTAHIGLFAVTDVGSELGLVTAYTIAVRAGGTIRVTIQRDQLINFCIYLPLAQTSAAAPEARHSTEAAVEPRQDAPEASQPGSEFTLDDMTAASRSERDDRDKVIARTRHEEAPAHHVLLVDDEPLLLKSLKRGLIRRGMRVTSTSSPLEALELLRQDSARFSIIVSDVRMPELNGPEMIQTARDEGLTLPLFVYITGHVEDHAAASFKVSPDRVLFKPFAIDDLHARLEELLKQSAAPTQSSP